MKILLIEDNKDIYEALKLSLKENNYDVLIATNISMAKNLLEDKTLHLIILDVTLPDGNGFDLYKNEIKNRNIPTIFLTAKTEEEDIVKGLELGAEDYITKPFGIKELLTRIKKICFRNSKESIITIKDLTFNLDNMTVKRNNTLIEFTALELKILWLLILNKGSIVKRDTILDKIWNWTGNDVDDHTITVYMKRIKDKLERDVIITIKGLGYKIDGE